MPILQVKGLPQKEDKRIGIALQKTALTIAELYGCDPKHVWATWEEIKPHLYLEGEVSANVQPLDSHPPLATLTCFEGLTDEQIAQLLEVVSYSLGEGLGLGDNIFVSYIEASSGKVIFGKEIVTSN